MLFFAHFYKISLKKRAVLRIFMKIGHAAVHHIDFK